MHELFNFKFTRRNFSRILALLAASLVAAPVMAALVLSIPFFSQNNSVWKNEKLGTSSYTIGQKGCAVTSMAMILRFRGASVDPSKLNKWLTANRGFANGSDIKWDVASGYNWTCWMVFEGTNSLSSVQQVKSQIDARKLIIARSNRFGTDSHFVVIRGYKGSGTKWSDFRYWDPADTSVTDRPVGDSWVKQGKSTRVFRY